MLRILNKLKGRVLSALLVTGIFLILGVPVVAQLQPENIDLSEQKEVELRRIREQHIERIRGYYAKGMYDKVLEECEELEKIEPGSSEARLYRVLAQDKIERSRIAEELGTTSTTTVSPITETTILSTPMEGGLSPVPTPYPSVEEQIYSEESKSPLAFFRNNPIFLIIIGVGILVIIVGAFAIMRLRATAKMKAKLSEVEAQVRQAIEIPEEVSSPEPGRESRIAEVGAGEQVTEVVFSSLDEEPVEDFARGEEKKESAPSQEEEDVEARAAELEFPPEPEAEKVETPELAEESELPPLFVPEIEKREEMPPEQKDKEKIPEPTPVRPESPEEAEEIIEVALPSEAIEEEEEVVSLNSLDELIEEEEKEISEGVTKEGEQGEVEENEEKAPSGTVEFGGEYDRMLFTDLAQEETIISPEISYEDTIIEKDKITPSKEAQPSSTEEGREEFIPSAPEKQDEETIILTPEQLDEHPIAKILEQKKAEEMKESVPESIPEKKEPELHVESQTEGPEEKEEVFEKIDLSGLTEIKPEEKEEEREKRIEQPEKIEQRQERLFEDQYARGCEALEKGDWKKAIHYLTIALALRPDHQDTKAKLHLARQKRHEQKS